MHIRNVAIGLLLFSLTGVVSAESGGGEAGNRGDADGHHNFKLTLKQSVQAPEMAAGSVIAALTLLGGGLLVLRGSRRGKSGS